MSNISEVVMMSQVDAKVTANSSHPVASGGVATEIAKCAKLASTNTFQGSLILNSADETATAGRMFTIYDYATAGSWLGSDSYPAQLRRLEMRTNPSIHAGFVGLYSITDSAWEGGLQFGDGQTTFLGRRNIDGTVYKTPKVSFSKGSIINVADINGYTLAAACARGVTTSVTSGSTALLTSGGAYTKLQDYFPKAGGYVTGDISPSTNNNLVLGTTDHYWAKLRCHMWASSGTPVWRSGAADQSCIVKSLGLYSLTRNSSDTAASYTYSPMYASAFNNKSSKRYKDHKSYISDEQAKSILELKPAVYDYKNKDNGVDCEGLYAEDVYDKIPYCVTLDEEERPDSIDYSRLIPRMVRMIQVLQDEIDQLKTKLGEE